MYNNSFKYNSDRNKFEQEFDLTGSQINYYYVCKRKLWLSSHYIGLKTNSDIVMMGKLLHENSYKHEHKKELEFERVKIDFLRKTNEIHEIKKSQKIEKAHIFQLLYYLYLLKYITNMTNIKGIIDYPLLKKRIEVILTVEYENELKSAIKQIKVIIQKEKPPEPEWKPYCKKCAYEELCWS